MKAYHTITLPIFTALICLCAATSAGAQVQIGADLSPRSTPEGEPVEFRVRVVGTGQHGDPVVKTDPSINVTSAGAQSSFTMNFGGDRSSDKTYIFHLQPSKMGQFKVEAEVPITGDALLSEPFTLTVREKTAAEKAREPFLKLSTDARNIYVGQLVPVEITLFLSEGSRLRSGNIAPELQTNDFVPQSFTGPFYGKAKVPQYEPFDYNTSVTALKSGKLTLGPAKLQAVIDIPYGIQVQRKQFLLESDPLNIEIKPLPEEGKPKSFDGAVGSFKLAMDAEPLRLAQGDPISVTIQVAGDGNFPAVNMPHISESSGWKTYPARKFENNDRRTGQTTSLTFTQVLIPLDMKKEIPSFEFSFFDPIKEKYETQKTDPIPIEVSASTAPLPVASQDGSALPAAPITPDAIVPVADMNDILSIRPIADFSLIAPPVPVYRTDAFWIAQSVPLGAFALMFLFFVREKRMARGPKKLKSHVPEFADLLQNLQQNPPSHAAAFYQAASSALDSWEYHAGRTIHSLRAPELDLETHAVRERHGVLRFSGAKDADSPITSDERRNVIATLTKLQNFTL